MAGASEDAKQELDRASQHDPRESRFGYFAHDDYHLASVGLFFWFSSSAELLRAIVELEPYVYGEPANLQRKLAEAVGDVSTTSLTSEVLGRVNEAAKNAFQVDWWGTFETLRSEDAEWERDLREQFRELQLEDPEEEPSSAEIREDEVDDFVEFLREYGH